MAAEAMPVYCLDSCCLIDWLKDAPENIGCADAVDLLFEDAQKGDCRIVIPAVVVAELLPGKCGDRLPNFIRMLSGSQRAPISVHSLDFPMARAVAELRDDLGVVGKSRAFDIMILAAAMHGGANVLYTGDKKIMNLNKRVSQLTRNRPIAEGFEIREIGEYSPSLSGSDSAN